MCLRPVADGHWALVVISMMSAQDLVHLQPAHRSLVTGRSRSYLKNQNRREPVVPSQMEPAPKG